MIKHLNTFEGKPVTRRILTVAQLAEQLNSMVDRGLGELPVFSSDGRARYPFGTVVPYSHSGYPDCLLIQPEPHLHAEVSDSHRYPASYFERINTQADQVRAACGAFYG